MARRRKSKKQQMMPVAAPSQPQIEMSGRKIMIAIPCHAGSIELPTFRSLMNDLIPMIYRGDEIQLFDKLGHADIYLLRAQIVANFMQTDCTDLVMIDSDVGWEPLGLMRLVDHEVDFVAGAYPKREYPLTFMFRSALEAGEGLKGNADVGLIEVWGMPGGFMRIKRSVIEKMYARYGDELTAYDKWVPGEKTVRLFDPYWWTADDGKRRCLSEDYAFCQRWRDMGGQVFMDVQIAMGHCGKHEFVGKMGEWLDENLTRTDKYAKDDETEDREKAA